MAEDDNPLDPITFHSGINYDLRKVVLKFDRRLEILCLEAGSAKELGRCLIELSDQLKTVDDPEILESKGVGDSDESDEVRPETGQPARPETSDRSPGDCS